ncbi:MAG: hypothetical protein WBX02_20530 [Terriglobales bacterium]
MDRLLASIVRFHDSMAKEIHLVNRGYVLPDKSMRMNHRYDAQILIQSQWEPFGLELLFVGIQELHLARAGEYWEGSGSVEVTTTPVETRRIKMAFDADLKVVSESLFYRIRREWLGNKAFLKSEVPSPDAVPSLVLQDKWRQCSSCQDAWEEEISEDFSHCPKCGNLTVLQKDVA